MTTTSDLPDCTIYCNSTKHGDIITASLSKKSISDFNLCAFLNYTCMRCESVRDSVGRTALHVAASCGRLGVVKWLIRSRHADIDAKDKESGYTALHRSIFYGKIHVAVELIKLGASVTDLDHDSLNILDHAMLDGLQPRVVCGELYSWGSNNNNLLGPQQAREGPELLDVFHKKYPKESVTQICINQFHSVIVTKSGKAYSCGHGQGGRLGLGTEQTTVTPCAVDFSDSSRRGIIGCIEASISRDHSIFLCEDRQVFTCGINTYRVLGINPPPEKILIPTPIKRLDEDIIGVCAGRYHSVAWGPKALFTWGLNGGQLGHRINYANGEEYIITPKQVWSINFDEMNIKTVAISDAATAVCTNVGDIYVLHKHLCRKVASRYVNVIQIDITGGKIISPIIDKELSSKLNLELKVVALTDNGNLFLWQELDPQVRRCIFSINREIFISQVAINTNEILLVTDYGEAFKGYPKKRKPINIDSNTNKSKSNAKSAFHRFLERDECVLVQLKKIPKIHRAVRIQSDAKGKDFCIIQAHPYKFFKLSLDLKSEMTEHFRALLKEADESDSVHDVVFKVGKKFFPAHRYILSSRSPYFEKMFYENKEEVITLANVNDVIFEQFLQYIYTGSCELSKCGYVENEALRNLCQINEITEGKGLEGEKTIPAHISAYYYYKKSKVLQEPKDENNQTTKNPIRMLKEIAKRYKCKELQIELGCLEIHDDYVTTAYRNSAEYRNSAKYRKSAEYKYDLYPLSFDRNMFPNLYDVTIKCRDNTEIRAHKCILAARLEYFNNMFSMRWKGENISQVTLPCSRSVAEVLFRFIYTDSLSFLNTMDIDHLFEVLIVADLLFVPKLKGMCAYFLTNLLTLKNVVQVLLFADLYNAKELKNCCLTFITLNITALLELRSLDELGDELMKELYVFYFEDKQNIWCREITPYSTAPLDEEIASVISQHNFSLDREVEQRVNVKYSQKKKSRPHKSSLSEKNNSICFDDGVSVDSIIQFPDTPEIIPESKNNNTNVPDRIKAITLATNKIKEEDVELQYTKLSCGRTYNSFNLSRSFNEEHDFPDLNSPPSHSNNSFHHKSPTQKIDIKHKIIRLSQKQRKRLSSENNNASPSVSESPKNPWKIVPDISSPVSSVGVRSAITDIISDEKRQKGNLVKLTTKLLTYTQMEDRAIDDLHKFYNSENVTDEIIVIERVPIGAIASPVWVPGTK